MTTKQVLKKCGVSNPSPTLIRLAEELKDSNFKGVHSRKFVQQLLKEADLQILSQLVEGEDGSYKLVLPLEEL